MKTHSRASWRIIVGSVVVVLMIFGWMTPANAWGSTSACGGRPVIYHTNKWANFFAGHDIDVRGGVCTNGTYVFYSAKPQITFPSVPVLGWAETVEASDPFVSDVQWASNGKALSVTFKFSVKHCTNTPIQLCQNFDFTFKTAPIGSRICNVGGPCDEWKIPW